MEFNARLPKRLSIIGERPAFGTALQDLAEKDPLIMAVVADVTNSAGLERMKGALPDQVINVGIAEQNMMGIATGLASEGYKVVTTTFAPFQALRCLEQIRVNQGYMQQKVVMVGLASGVAYGELGYTHCCIEDTSILSSIPNISVITPADCFEVTKALEAALNYKDSVYIRLLDKTNVPIVYTDDYHFEIGKAVKIADGCKICVIANGTMVNVAIKARNQIIEQTGNEIAIYNMHTVKPLDTELLDSLKDSYDAIICIEEHSIHGGLGTCVSDYYAQFSSHPRIIKMGIADEYCHGASHETILEKYNLTVEGLCCKINSLQLL